MRPITVTIPDHHQPERQYAMHVLLKTCLGLSYQITIEPGTQTYLIRATGGELVLHDHFFKKYVAPGSYLKPDAIPDNPVLSEHPEMQDVVVLYGNDHLEETPGRIICHADLVAGAYFMLTRWEEFVLKIRDVHDRFPAAEALAVKCSFLHLPVVNIYAACIRKWLIKLGVPAKAFRERAFNKLLTCDVDYPFFWRDRMTLFRKMAGTLRRTGSISKVTALAANYAGYITGRRPDPYDTYEWLMDVAERNNAMMHFFLMSGGQTKRDPGAMIHDSRMQKRIGQIKERGHQIGLHPSYATFRHAEMLSEEKKVLEEATGQPITFGRQHYLRFRVPMTWQVWEEAGMAWDSTMGYAARTGFRCGICFPFPVFDILARQQLDLLERPLLVMDVTLRNYMGLSIEEAEKESMQVMGQVRRFGGEFVLLWHNNYFRTTGWEGWTDVFEILLKS